MKASSLSACIALLLTITLSGHPSYAGQSVLIVGDAHYPPYSYIHGGQPAGIYVDILRRAFSRMPDFEVTIRMLPWKRALNRVEVGKALAVFPPYRHDLQRPYIAPYSTPILKEELVAVCVPDMIPDKASGVWPEDYFHLTFAINAGFEVGGDRFLKAKSQKNLRVVEVHDAESGMLMLSRKRTDCYINDRYSIAWAASALRLRGNRIDNSYTEAAIIKTQYGRLGYSKKFQARYKREFISQFDNVIAAMKQSGEIDVIVHNYLTNASGYDFGDKPTATPTKK